jgi:hypothetical protein
MLGPDSNIYSNMYGRVNLYVYPIFRGDAPGLASDAEFVRSVAGSHITH